MKRRLELTPDAMALVAARFKVMSEPLRLRIIQILEAGERSIGQLTETLGAGQPNVSKHVRILQEAGLVARRQDGNTVYCRVADPTVFELCEVVCSSLQQGMTRQVQSPSPPRQHEAHS